MEILKKYWYKTFWTVTLVAFAVIGSLPFSESSSGGILLLLSMTLLVITIGKLLLNVIKRQWSNALKMCVITFFALILVLFIGKMVVGAGV